VLGAVSDITAQCTNEIREAELQEALRRSQRLEAVGQLAGGVAHDFNNLLAAILASAELLTDYVPDGRPREYADEIQRSAIRGAALVRQLLTFAQRDRAEPRAVELNEIVMGMEPLLRRSLGEHVQLQITTTDCSTEIVGDPTHLEQVILNLSVNARDAMLAKDPLGGGTLTLQTFAVSAEDVRRMGSDVLPIGDYTAMKVTDTGTGIPQHLMGKIFEPFFTTKEVGKGTGLGLSTVYGIVKQSGGFIFAESQVRKGTSFTIYLPVHRAQAGEAPAKARPKEKAGELWGTGTVLIVEDEVMVRTVAERALARHGYTVLVAENGEAALEILGREDKVDLMISDVVMPTMDGPTTVRAARKMHPDLPILFISGYAEEQLRKSIDIPNVAFLAKPFSVQQLAETVRDVLAAK
jgi:two-component system cell cycle sensor histidine kinase/response regulator CckA